LKLRVAIAEDEEYMRKILKKALEPVQGVEVIYETDNGRDLIEHVELLNPHAVFLDIEMPGMDGLTAAKEIADIYPDTALVFVTGYPEHMAEAFELYAFDYLVKPFAPERVRQTARRITKAVNTLKKAVLFDMKESESDSDPKTLRLPKLAVGRDGEKIYLDYKDIIFLTREQRKTLIYTVSREEPVQTNEPLNSIYNRLNDQNFFRSHKSFIVNLNYVEALAKWGAKSYQVTMKHTNKRAQVSTKILHELEERLS